MSEPPIFYFRIGLITLVLLCSQIEVWADQKNGSATFIYGDRNTTLAGLKRAWGFSAFIKYDGRPFYLIPAGVRIS